MSRASFFRRLIGSARPESKPVRRTQLAVEALEDRFTPSAYTGDVHDWMKYLPDSRSLSQLSIPGTHDTMTYGTLSSVENLAGHIIQCQTMTLEQQLNAGIRFLDIRVGKGENTEDLALYHGDFALGMSFNTDVVKTCKDFLRDHPKETIVMSIGDDHGAGTDHINHVVGDNVSGSDQGRWYSSAHVPTLKDVRGKIVILDSYSGAYGIPFFLPYQAGGYANGGVFWGSNRYSLPGNSVSVQDVINAKKSDIENALAMPQQVPKTNTAWFVTYTTANMASPADYPGQLAFDLNFPTLGINPWNVAEGINYSATPFTVEHYPGVNEFLSGKTFDGRVGTVVMDFVRGDVIKEVIGANNAAPTDIVLSNAVVPKTASKDTFVGEFSTIDPDNNPSDFKYSLVVGDGSTDNDAFYIDADGKLLTKDGSDFGTKSSYSIRVRSTDTGGLPVANMSAGKMFVEKVFTVSAGDIALSNTVVQENVPLHTWVGDFSTTRPGSQSSDFTYSLVGGAGSDDNAAFAILTRVSDTSVLTTGGLYWDPGFGQFGGWRSHDFDFETKSSYSIRVRSTYNPTGVSFEQVIPIRIADVNEKPTDITLSGNSVPENKGLGWRIGNLSTTDPDRVDSHSYALVSGPGDDDNSSFAIYAGALWSNASFDFEAKPSYSVRVLCTDAGGLSFEKVFTITVTNVNEVPTDITMTNASFPENAPIGTIGIFSTIDPDNDPHAYSLDPGVLDNSLFRIKGYELSRVASYYFDFEAKPSFSIRVKSTDAGGLSVEKDFTITVTDVNEKPTNITLSNASIPENAPNTVIGTFSSTDADSGSSFTYSLVDGAGSDDNAAFSVSDDGTLSTKTGLDFEAKPSYSIRVRSTDNGGLSFEKVFTIKATDVNDAPTITSPAAQTVREDVSTLISGISVDDQDRNNLSVVLRVGHGTLTLDTDLDVVGNGTGAVSLHGRIDDLNAALDTLVYRGASDFAGADTLRITASDAGFSANRNVAITVAAVDDAPAVTLASTLVAVNQGSAPFAQAGFAAFNPGGGSDEAGQQPTYTLTNTNNALFSSQPAIDANGTLTFTLTPGATGSATVTVLARDNGGTDSGGADTAVPVQFTITVSARLALVGTDPCASGRIRMIDPLTGTTNQEFTPFAGYDGDVTVATGDVNGDGAPDVIVGTATGSSHVKVFSGADGSLLHSFLAFPGSTEGVTVGAGDVNGDGAADLIVGAASGSSMVEVFDGRGGGQILGFEAFGGFTGGVSVAGGDLDGDGRAEVLVGANANTHVKAFGADGTERLSFLADPGLGGAVRVAARDTDGDGRAEIVTGTGPGGAHVKRFDGQSLALLDSFDAFDPSFTGGVFVG